MCVKLFHNVQSIHYFTSIPFTKKVDRHQLIKPMCASSNLIWANLFSEETFNSVIRYHYLVTFLGSFPESAQQKLRETANIWRNFIYWNIYIFFQPNVECSQFSMMFNVLRSNVTWKLLLNPLISCTICFIPWQRPSTREFNMEAKLVSCGNSVEIIPDFLYYSLNRVQTMFSISSKWIGKKLFCNPRMWLLYACGFHSLDFD